MTTGSRAYHWHIVHSAVVLQLVEGWVATLEGRSGKLEEAVCRFLARPVVWAEHFRFLALILRIEMSLQVCSKGIRVFVCISTRNIWHIWFGKQGGVLKRVSELFVRFE